jgi:hypothetical protein
MEGLHTSLMSSRGVSETSATQYVRNLFSLNNQHPFSNLAWLKNVASIEQRLADYAVTTQKSMVTSIVSALSTVKDKPTYKRIYAHWYSELMSRGAEARETDTKVKTEKQEQNWLSWEVVKAHLERLRQEVLINETGTTITPSQWDTLLSLMVLSLYTEFPPRRNQDFQFMKVVHEMKDAEDENFNYLVVEDHKFVFNKYKTAKTYGQQVFDIPTSLVETIRIYLGRHPLKYIRPTKATRGKKKTLGAVAPFFLVSYNGDPLLRVNSITRILNRIFGRHIGATMLRHIYLTDKYDVTEMDKDAEAMAHTPGLQREYMKGGDGEESSQSVVIPMLEG